MAIMSLLELRPSRDVVPQALTILLRTLGHYVGMYPWWVVSITVVMSLGFAGSTYWTLDYQTNIEQLYIPIDADSWTDRRVAEHYFPVNFSGRFQPDRREGLPRREFAARSLLARELLYVFSVIDPPSSVVDGARVPALDVARTSELLNLASCSWQAGSLTLYLWVMRMTPDEIFIM
ncbi:unnamed protein product [Notodromas monacha]|uniref:Uncharacterized protein n=1 Tax=Notodromas monacha TaxID=399045 RepID=A0A7R9BM76_9CRUS|nr:unnamed protein product [Notodromas monacha]CAG0916582.1 unnamed protein product [Notodromas monacha]